MSDEPKKIRDEGPGREFGYNPPPPAPTSLASDPESETGYNPPPPPPETTVDVAAADETRGYNPPPPPPRNEES